MAEQTDAAAYQPERTPGGENLYQRFKQGKEIADLRSRLDLFQSFLSQSDFYSQQVARSKGDQDTHLGDYGNFPAFTKNYLLDRIFVTIGARDSSENPLSVNSLRNLAAHSPDEFPKLRLSAEAGEIIDIDFFAGKNDVNFGCWLRGLSEDKKAEVVSSLENLPPRIWAKSIVQQLSEQQGQILEHEGVFSLPVSDWTTSDSISDLTYFLNDYEFSPKFGWTREEVEAVLNDGTVPKERGSIASWIDPATNESWHVFPARGIALAVKKNGSAVTTRILIDTVELRGRTLPNSFLDSQTARELLGVFEKLGLEPSDEMLNDFTEGSLGFGHYSPRYGNGYADLSRLVTYIAREGSGIERLVSVSNPNFTAESLLQETENLSAPVKLILKMMAGIMKRGAPAADQPFRISSFSGQSIRDGSCKDSEVYFSNSLKLGKSFQEEDIFISKSGYGADTKINVVPIVADGIEFPAGYLFRVSAKGELEPLRATMYCFNSAEARDAFGWQYAEALNNDPFLKQAIDNFPEGWNIPTRAKPS